MEIPEIEITGNRGIGTMDMDGTRGRDPEGETGGTVDAMIGIDRERIGREGEMIRGVGVGEDVAVDIRMRRSIMDFQRKRIRSTSI